MDSTLPAKISYFVVANLAKRWLSFDPRRESRYSDLQPNSPRIDQRFPDYFLNDNGIRARDDKAVTQGVAQYSLCNPVGDGVWMISRTSLTAFTTGTLVTTGRSAVAL